MTDKLPVRLAADLAILAEEHRWLIQDLWAAQAVGVVGGEPKCCKSFLALDMAVAVASAFRHAASFGCAGDIRATCPVSSQVPCPARSCARSSTV
jgi:hypothetical protein